MSAIGYPMSDDAMLLVEAAIDPMHPGVIRNQLAQQVRKLLRERVAHDVIRDALVIWDGKSGSPPSWLPHMVSDAIRLRRAQVQEGERKSALSDWEEQLKKEMNG